MLLIAGEFRVTPDKSRRFADLAIELSAATRLEDGCHAFEFWSDLDGSGRFALFEKWESAAHLLAHREMTHVEAFKKGIAELGIELESLTLGDCHTKLRLEPKHLQQDGYVHAGVQATIADHTAGAAAATLVRPDEIVLSAEFKINLLRPAQGEILRCTSTVLKPGSRLIVVESDVEVVSPERSQRVAKGMFTLAVVPRPSEL